jgi:hypothetical protein
MSATASNAVRAAGGSACILHGAGLEPRRLWRALQEPVKNMIEPDTTKAGDAMIAGQLVRFREIRSTAGRIGAQAVRRSLAQVEVHGRGSKIAASHFGWQ